MVHQPEGAAFDVVLLLHVGCVVAGLVTTLAAATTASRLGSLLGDGAPLPDALVRYFRPGFNWAGRSVWGIPVFGAALLAMSRGAYTFGDSWVLAGLAVFAGVVLLDEGILWPAERRLQSALAENPGRPLADVDAAVHDARTMSRAAAAALVLLVVGTAVMVAQP